MAPTVAAGTLTTTITAQTTVTPGRGDDFRPVARTDARRPPGERRRPFWTMLVGNCRADESATVQQVRAQVRVTAEDARRFLVARHFLSPARSLAGGSEAVREVLQRLGSIQFDPVAVAGRNHDLVLHARVAGYDPSWCDGLYERRKIVEVTNKALSFVATSEFPWFRLGWGRKGPRFHAAALADNPGVSERVLDRIRADGPLSSADFERESGPTKDWFGMPENAVRAVLEAYTVTGVLGLARRDGNVRYHDLLERLLPAEVLAQEVPVREQLRHKLLSRYRAHGLLGTGGAGGTFDRIAPPTSTPEQVGRNELRAELVERGALVPVQ